jgi:hypothetical protein
MEVRQIEELYLGWLIASRMGKAVLGVLYTRLVPETCLQYYIYIAEVCWNISMTLQGIAC